MPERIDRGDFVNGSTGSWPGSQGTHRQEEIHGHSRALTLTDIDQAAGVSTEADRAPDCRLRAVHYAGEVLTFG